MRVTRPRRATWARAGSGWLCFLVLLPLAGAAENEEVRSQIEEWRETLQFGIDSQVLEIIDDIVSAREERLNQELSTLLAESSNSEIRAAVLDYYAELESPAGTAAALAVVELHEDHLQSLVSSAIRYLSAMGSADSAEPLMRVAQTAAPHIAASAVQALGAVNAEGTEAFLLELFSEDETADDVRNQIVLALGKTGGTEAVDLLLELVADSEEDRFIRLYGCAALGEIGDSRAVDVLRKVFAEKDALLRTYAAAALGHFPDADVLPLLMQALRDSNWKVRLEAARAIADGGYSALDSAGLVPMLQYKVEKDPVKNVRKEAMRALAASAGQEGIDTLRGVYESEGEGADIREAALEQLIEHDLRGSLESVRVVMAQEWERKQQRVLEVTAARLSAVEADYLGDVFRELLQSANISVRVAAIRGIARNGYQSEAGRLREIADSDPYPAGKREALGALEKLGLPYEPEPSE